MADPVAGWRQKRDWLNFVESCPLQNGMEGDEDGDEENTEQDDQQRPNGIQPVLRLMR
jgi:hypothetical protein